MLGFVLCFETKDEGMEEWRYRGMEEGRKVGVLLGGKEGSQASTAGKQHGGGSTCSQVECICSLVHDRRRNNTNANYSYDNTTPTITISVCDKAVYDTSTPKLNVAN